MKRLTAILLVICMMFTTVPSMAYADIDLKDDLSSYEEGLCEHHPVHDENCGFEPSSKGEPCSHMEDGEHDDSCYELICGYEEGEIEEDRIATKTDVSKPHEHDDSCYELICPHMDGEHDEACGYEEPVKGHECGFVCEACLQDATSQKAPRDTQYTVMFEDDDPEPVNGITTYKVTKLNSGEYINRNMQITEGNVVFDLTEAVNNTSSDEAPSHLGLRVMNPGSKITIIGDPDEEYYMKIDLPNAFVSGPVPYQCYAAELVLEDIYLASENDIFTATAEGDYTITYSGRCRIGDFSFSSGNSRTDSVTFIGDGNDSCLYLGNIYNDSNDAELSFKKCNVEAESSITTKHIDIEDSIFSFTNDIINAGIRYAYIEAGQVSITGSTITGIEYLNSGRTEAEEGSSLSIDDSDISFNHLAYEGIMLGNFDKISIINGSYIEGDVSGPTSTFDAAVGGEFDTLTIEDSTVKAMARYGAAIGTSRSQDGDNAEINISGSTIEAASRYGAAIGMGAYSNASAMPSNPTEVKINISNNSDIMVKSVYSAAIGAGYWFYTLGGNDDGKIPIEVGDAEIGGWDAVSGSGSTGELRLQRLSPMARAAVSREDIIEKISLMEGAKITITGENTINAQSGVLAIYADSVTCNNMPLVQNTMFLQSGSGYTPYSAEASGEIRIGGELLGEIGYGYASVASSEMAPKSAAEMCFNDSALTDITNGSTSFDIKDTGFQEFFTVPELNIYGAARLLDENGSIVSSGTAEQGDKLTVDLSSVYPESVRDGSRLRYQWYRGEAAIANATLDTYIISNEDDDSIVYCKIIASGGYVGEIESDGVFVGESSIPAPELSDRTETSISLKEVQGYSYSIDHGVNWQKEPVFTGLEPGRIYTFIQKSGENLSPAVSFSTLSDRPELSEFVIDYVNEELSFPSGVLIYDNADLSGAALNAYTQGLSLPISKYIGGSGEEEKRLYAVYQGSSAVTEIVIPVRPAMHSIDEDDVIITPDSITFPASSGIEYRLEDAAGNVIVDAFEGTGDYKTVNGLTQGTDYVLKMRLIATNSRPDPHFRSEISSFTFNTQSNDNMSGRILVPAGHRSETEMTFDLSAWFGSNAISNAAEAPKDDGSLITDIRADGSIINIKMISVRSGDSTSLVVNAVNGWKLTLDIEAVNAVAESSDDGGLILWVRPVYPLPSYVDGMTEADINEAWDRASMAYGFYDEGRESFGIRPFYALGGLLANPDEGVSIRWTPDPDTQINMDRGAFLLLHIPKTGGGARMLSYQRTADSIVFDVTGQGGLYAVYYKDAEPVTMTASVMSESSTGDGSRYYVGDELSIEVNVAASDEENSPGSPTGKISVYYGDPANEGILLMSYELQQADSGRAVISYVVQEELAGIEPRNLYIVYTGDNNFLPFSVVLGQISFMERPEHVIFTEKPKYSSSSGGRDVIGPVGIYYQDGRHIPGHPLNGTWRQNETGWWFELYNGSWPAACWYQCWWNGEVHWYHFNADGYVDSGWFTDTDANIYYLHPYHDGNFGYMYTGDHIIGSVPYSFSTGIDQYGLPEGALIR